MKICHVKDEILPLPIIIEEKELLTAGVKIRVGEEGTFAPVDIWQLL